MAAKKSGKKVTKSTATASFLVEIAEVAWKLKLEKAGFYIMNCDGDLGDWFDWGEWDDIVTEVNRLRGLMKK